MHPGLLRDIVGWDIANWQQAIRLWEQVLPRRLDGWNGLEIGAAAGGLSLYLGLKGANMICSDFRDPKGLAEPLMLRYGLEPDYLSLDARQALPFDDNSLDVICFKSVLGGLRKGAELDPKPALLAEIFRVLKPNGWLLLAENLQGHALHKQLRRRFVSWSIGWEYLTLEDLLTLLEPFEFCYRTTGVLGLLGRSEPQRRMLGAIDTRLAPWLPTEWHYLFVGAARKPE